MRDLTRRTFLGSGCALLLAACSSRTARSAPRDALEPTPNIPDEDDLPPVPAQACAADPTARNIEGPFYKKGAPHRSVLVDPNDDGQRIRITGTLQSTKCVPIGGAMIDVWQANAAGDYDLEGFRFRGALTTDAKGRYDLRTIIPGRYLNGDRYRPAHIHIKVKAKGFAVLTTQLYFAGDPYNDGDPFIDASLVMQHTAERDIRRARFDFVLPA
ncbi:MAG: dioxygenase [Deltaproteobacteria bacterium]|nr:dioxygenase [Deltaproteobacteria bacterium]